MSLPTPHVCSLFCVSLGVPLPCAEMEACSRHIQTTAGKGQVGARAKMPAVAAAYGGGWRWWLLRRKRHWGSGPCGSSFHSRVRRGRRSSLPAVPSGTASPPRLLPVEQPAGPDADAVVACLHLRGCGGKEIDIREAAAALRLSLSGLWDNKEGERTRSFLFFCLFLLDS